MIDHRSCSAAHRPHVGVTPSFRAPARSSREVVLEARWTWPCPSAVPSRWPAGSRAPFPCRLPLPCAPCRPAAPLGGGGLRRVSFCMTLALYDRLVAPTAGRTLRRREDLDAGTRGLVAARHTDEHMERASGPSRSMMPPCRSFCVGAVLLDHVDVLHEHTSPFRHDAQHFAALAPLLAGDDADGVAATNVNGSASDDLGGRR